MKKLLFTILITLCLLPGVKAESIVIEASPIPQDNYCSLSGCNNSFDQAYKDIINYYNSNYKNEYPYYVLSYNYAQANKMTLYIFKDGYTFGALQNNFLVSFSDSINLMHTFYDNSFATSGSESSSFFSYSYSTQDQINYYSLIDSNIDIVVSGSTYEIQGYYKDSIILEPGTILPTYLQLKEYDSWSDYPSINTRITEVNLDNYEYVILSLKNYSKKEAFDTNLQVKGMIGITPVYEFGTAEKNDITDRCNVSYSDYTDHRLYILKNDLINSAVYYVKACEEQSSFKFDSSIFNITYVTADNVNDPVITVGGQDYHTIPFESLTNSANQNEDNNFIPGETGSSFSDVINNVTSYISSFWNSLSTLMSLVTKFFNTLPIEIRAISITAFTTALTLGVIKFIKS